MDVSNFSDAALKVGIESNKDVRRNFVRLEKTTDRPTGVSNTDPNGGKTSYWTPELVESSGGTTPSHEYNHGAYGLDHPERP